ncbi:MAG: hypothetical protein KC501_28415 [Myxococcales bacterium]|nr:hypothetical protein [Myxococcales bacterium]
MRRILAHALVTTALVVGCDSKPAEAPVPSEPSPAPAPAADPAPPSPTADPLERDEGWSVLELSKARLLAGSAR